MTYVMPQRYVVYGVDNILGGGLVNLGSFGSLEAAQAEYDAPRTDGYTPRQIITCTPANPWGRP